MATRDQDALHLKFTVHFRGFNGGMRELRYIARKLGVNSDTYQNPEDEIRLQIARYLDSREYSRNRYDIEKYLAESKVGIDVFDFIDDSQSQSILINDQIAKLRANSDLGFPAMGLVSSFPLRSTIR